MKKNFLFLYSSLLFFAANTSAWSQSDTSSNSLDELMNLTEEGNAGKEYTSATFKSTRLIVGQSIENVGVGVLDFRISHRFNSIDKGLKDMFGLDGATIRLGLDYGVTKRLTVGLGRSSYEKEIDGYLKYKVLQQTTDNKMPVTVSYVGNVMLQTMEANIPVGYEYYFSNRICYSNQLLIARKFNKSFSVQLMPTHIHYNLVDKANEQNDVFGLGIGNRLKLSNRVSLNLEYYYVLDNTKLQGTNNALSIGFDIETGGHVFQLHFTNASGMTDRTFIGKTTGQWTNNGIRFGFNISRVFTVKKPKGFENSRNKIY